MIVVDASCVIHLVLQLPASSTVARRLFDGKNLLAAPALVDVEVCHVLRKYWIAREITASRVSEAIDALNALPIVRHSHAALLDRIWQWRNNVSAYDAAYAALAETLDATLITCDKKLAASLGRKIQVEVY
jgi:predicted nucleic acid-binding protein